MSFQINASYSEQIHFEATSAALMYGYLLEATREMGWSVGTHTRDAITAYAGLSICSFGEVIHMQINKNVVDITSTCLMPQLWSIGKNKRNIRRLGRQINQLMDSCCEQQLRHSYMVASAAFVASEASAGPAVGIESGRPGRFNITESTHKISGFLSVFNPKPGYFVTPILIHINIFIFLLIGLAGAGLWSYNLHGFEYLGANLADTTLGHGQWWRLLSYQFMHAGYVHLIGNMFALLMIGVYLEPILGRVRFLVFYLICGMAGGLLGLYIHPFYYAVGASGAIFGMYGVFLALLTSDLIEKHTRKAIFSTLIFFLSLHLLAGLQGVVDNSAHIGGIITGFMLGKISTAAIKADKSWLTFKRVSAITIVTVVFFSFCLMKMPNQASSFRKIVTQFSLNESMALSYMEHFDDRLDEHIAQAILRNIQYQSLGFWKQNALLLDQLDELHIGITGHSRVQLMRKYVYIQVKKASFALLWMIHNHDIEKNKNNAIDGLALHQNQNKGPFMDSVKDCDNAIEYLMQELNENPWTFR